MRCYFIPTKLEKEIKSDSSKCWWEHGVMGSPLLQEGVQTGTTTSKSNLTVFCKVKYAYIP